MSGLTILGAAGLGAGLMYLLDPREGNRRRALIRDQAVSVLNRSDDYIEKTARDLRNRTRGLVAETMSALEEPVRVRDRMSQERLRSGDGRANWSPTARLVSSAGGLAMTAYGLSRRGISGTAMALTGLGLAARGITNQDIKKLVGIGAGRNAVVIQKTINIDAPVEEVYRFWENVENFPRFMEHVEEVKDKNNGIYHWKVAGPAGAPVEFDAITVKKDLNQMISWKSLPNEAIKSAGVVHFRPNNDGSTRVTVKMSYNPPAGAIGHVVASLFGVDPKEAMDNDLVRMKSLIEQGRTTAQGEQVTKEEISGTFDDTGYNPPGSTDI